MNGRMLITGATGCVGSALAEQAARGGWRVRGLSRGRTVQPAIPGGELVVGAVEDRDAMLAAARGCTAVVHLASWVHRVPKSPADHDALHSSIVDGTRNAAEAARSVGAPLIVASTVAVYGSETARCIDEDAPTAPVSPYGRAKLEAEAVALATWPQTTVLRLALVYGPKDRGNFRALIRAIDRHRALVVSPGTNRKALVFVDNAAERILHVLAAAESTPPPFGVWNVVDPYIPTQRELMATIARHLGRVVPPAVPARVLELGATLADRAASALGRSQNLADKVRKLSLNSEFTGSRLDTRLSYRPSIALEEGVARAVRAYRAEG